MKDIILPEELCLYAIELMININKETEINKKSFKNMNFYKKQLNELLKKEYPNLDLNQKNIEFSYNEISEQVSFNVI